jgi:predicted cupin superfamily sugar epimerase
MEFLIDKFNMQAHPEGGFFTETYRSEGKFDQKSYSTGIYFLLRKNDISHLHRIKSDEMWHFYDGDPLKVVEIDESGKIIETILGTDYEKGMVSQYVVKANRWFGSMPLEGVSGGSDYCFVGCTVSPGFEFEDFELASFDSLATEYPQHRDLLKKICIG